MTASAVLLAASASDFSVVTLFMNADLFVKGIMGILIVASVWSWTVIINKWMEFGSLREKARRFEEEFWAGRSLEDLASHLANRPDSMSKVFNAAMREFQHDGRSPMTGSALLSLNQRIDRVMGLVVAREATRAEKGLGVLASVGSAAPFIGLLGTVWGIMSTFRVIGASGDANLAVVAQPIAEALFTTALGLIAAVPAVIFYNKFASDSVRFMSQLEGFAEELSAILSRRLDRGA